MPAKAEVMQMAEQTELELPLGVLFNPDPQEVASDVQKATASGSSTLQEKNLFNLGPETLFYRRTRARTGPRSAPWFLIFLS